MSRAYSKQGCVHAKVCSGTSWKDTTINTSCWRTVWLLMGILSRGGGTVNAAGALIRSVAATLRSLYAFISPEQKKAMCRDKSNRCADVGNMFTDKSHQSLKRNTELDLIWEAERKSRKRSTRSGRGQLVHTSVRDLSSRNSWHEGTWFTAAAQSACSPPPPPCHYRPQPLWNRDVQSTARCKAVRVCSSPNNGAALKILSHQGTVRSVDKAVCKVSKNTPAKYIWS
jgi:hypothetical protein